MAIASLFDLFVEPLLWSLVTFFGLSTIINAFNNATTKAKKYAITASVLVFILAISDEIARILSFVL